MTSLRLILLPTVLALASGGLFLVHCIDGTTPNCSGDAGCGPGVEAGPDTGYDAGGDHAAPADTGLGSTDTGTASDAPRSG